MSATLQAPIEEMPKMQLAVVVSFLIHLGVFGFIFLMALMSKHSSSQVPIIELVQLEQPRIRPLQPKIKMSEPPPEEPEPTRPEEAPKLTPIPTHPESKKPEPKIVKPNVDSTRKIKDVAETPPEAPQQLIVSTVTDSRLTGWVRGVKKKADMLWNPPSGIDIAANALVKVSFIVKREGLIESPKIATSSHNSMLDENALNTIIRMEHVPPIPPSYPEDQIEVGIEFPYKAP